MEGTVGCWTTRELSCGRQKARAPSKASKGPPKADSHPGKGARRGVPAAGSHEGTLKLEGTLLGARSGSVGRMLS